MHIGQCHLCLEQRPLRRSHILPEFMYGEVYEPESHTYLTVSSEPGQVRPLREQKGLREYLLCGDCEQRFSRLENYAARLLRRAAFAAEALAKARVHEPVVRLEPFDYPKFKLFGMSLLWRLGQCSNYMFSAVKLGPMLTGSGLCFGLKIPVCHMNSRSCSSGSPAWISLPH